MMILCSLLIAISRCYSGAPRGWFRIIGHGEGSGWGWAEKRGNMASVDPHKQRDDPRQARCWLPPGIEAVTTDIEY